MESVKYAGLIVPEAD